MPTFAKNKKAYHEYEILEEFEAGIVLRGHEVKAIKKGRVSIKGSYARIKNGEMFLVGATIPPFQPKNTPQKYNEQRKRKLLLKKKQIQYLAERIEKKGLTIVPLKVYSVKGKIKIKIGLAKGRKQYDKRRKIKEEAEKREMKRQVKKFNK